MSITTNFSFIESVIWTGELKVNIATRRCNTKLMHSNIFFHGYRMQKVRTNNDENKSRLKNTKYLN